MLKTGGMTPETGDKIKEGARLRSIGESWGRIATRLGYANGESARKVLAGMYPDLWRTEFELARGLYLDVIEGEAIVTQRELLRATRIVSKIDPKTGKPVKESKDNPLDIRQRAAHSVLAHCAKQRASKVQVVGSVEHKGPVDLAARIKAYAEALDDPEEAQGESDGQDADA